MLRMLSALIPAHRRVTAAVEHLVNTKDGQPLLDLIRHGHVRWISLGNSATSRDGHLRVENDRYFYLTVRLGLSSYCVSSLTTMTMASKLECAAVNASRIANAVDCYTPESPDYCPELES